MAFEQADSGESNKPMHADQRNPRMLCAVSNSRRSCVGIHPTIRRRTIVGRTCATEIASVAALPPGDDAGLHHRLPPSRTPSSEQRPEWPCSTFLVELVACNAGEGGPC